MSYMQEQKEKYSAPQLFSRSNNSTSTVFALEFNYQSSLIANYSRLKVLKAESSFSNLQNGSTAVNNDGKFGWNMGYGKCDTNRPTTMRKACHTYHRIMLIFARQSKTLSDDMGPSLELQGMPWIIRKAVSFATITGKLSQTKDPEDVTCIQIAQTATGGIKGETEVHKLDGKDYAHSSGVFGTQVVNTSWVHLKSEHSKGLEGWLREGWLEGDDNASPGNIHVSVKHDKAGWTAHQVWGFAMVEGKRYFVKRFLVQKGSSDAKVRMVYEWKDV